MYNEVKNLHEQLSPVTTALNSMQSDHTTIADVREQWIELGLKEELQPYKGKVDKQRNQVLTPHHYLANLLHPHYRGKHLSSEQVQAADEVVF